jgi:hypothetical protein
LETWWRGRRHITPLCRLAGVDAANVTTKSVSLAEK